MDMDSGAFFASELDNKKSYGKILGFCLLLIGIIYLSSYNYVLFHTIIELLGIIIMVMIAMIGLNSFQYNQNKYLLILGIGYGFVAIFDLLHTLSYEGLGIFEENTTDLATQLWIMARYIESSANLSQE